ncbi:DUF4350 domain-containing protein [Neobacillus mesonae]|uniref:DUF4350 domain-containing protein n=1 Tax=Neobacillus mesonae TaxID=1193713 RepID=UPI00203C9BF0|nr:DUF4350 domain-containing protein [Neobacillus mesonae]MCM3567689.1 DUF4350 domain-containing protein [Neobacillus mesonae]
MKKARQGWIWLAVLLVVFIIVSYISFSPKPKFYPGYVSDSPSPTGVKGFYTYLNKELKVKRWHHSPEFLPKSQKNEILVMVEPLNIPETKEMNEYTDFIKSGNTILLLKKNPKGMFDVNILPGEFDSNNEKVSKVYDENNKAFKAVIKSYIRLELEQGDSVLLHDQSGVVALKHSIGKGKLIVAVAPEWLMNQNILSYDHLPLVLSLLEKGGSQSILFDEYLHGTKAASDTLNVYPKWFLLLILQGTIMAMLWLWLKGKRFGPIFTPREDSVRFSDEGIRALAAWYIRGRLYHDSLQIQADYVKFMLQERWQIPYSREWQDLSSLLERKWLGKKPSEIKEFLHGLTAVLEKEKIPKQEYVQWSDRLDRLQKEVEQG